MEAIVVAFITAVATIVSAIIQYRATLKLSRREPAKEPMRSREMEAGMEAELSDEVRLQKDKARIAAKKPKGRGGPLPIKRRYPHYIYWYLWGSPVVMAVTIFGIVDPDYGVIINTLGLIPVSSLILAFVYPVNPAYSPLFVTITTGAGYLGYALSERFSLAFVPSDLPSVLMIYVANCLLVLGVDEAS